MTASNYQELIEQAGGDPVKLLSQPIPPFTPEFFPTPKQYTNWRDEQAARKTTATLFDQDHMVDLFIKGPDTMRLLSDTAVNSFASFGPNKAKQYLAVNKDGYIIGDAVLFGLSEDEVSIVGADLAARWLEYQAKVGGYNVEFIYEPGNFDKTVKKRFYRQMIEGPNAWKVMEKAAGGPLERTGFFQMSAFEIDGHRVQALNHTMGGVLGDESTGLELFGPAADEDAVVDAILKAGEEFGLLRGGSIAYLSGSAESGWVPNPMPAIFSDDMRAFRETLPPETAYFNPISGSFHSKRIEDYYVTPWDMGYGRMIKFDHDFIGRAALERMAGEKPRRRVWLSWNAEDTGRMIASAETGGDDRAKPMYLPIQSFTYDEVLIGDRGVGVAFLHGYTVNLGTYISLATVSSDVPEGAEVELVWGDPDGGAGNPFVPAHKQVRIRATISEKSPMA